MKKRTKTIALCLALYYLGRAPMAASDLDIELETLRVHVRILSEENGRLRAENGGLRGDVTKFREEFAELRLLLESTELKINSGFAAVAERHTSTDERLSSLAAVLTPKTKDKRVGEAALDRLDLRYLPIRSLKPSELPNPHNSWIPGNTPDDSSAGRPGVVHSEHYAGVQALNVTAAHRGYYLGVEEAKRQIAKLLGIEYAKPLLNLDGIALGTLTKQEIQSFGIKNLDKLPYLTDALRRRIIEQNAELRYRTNHYEETVRETLANQRR